MRHATPPWHCNSLSLPFLFQSKIKNKNLEFDVQETEYMGRHLRAVLKEKEKKNNTKSEWRNFFF